MSNAQLIIGMDFDNTIVCYDELFHLAACEERLIAPSLPRSKEAVRNAIRLLPDGESRWTRLQAIVYGLRMAAAAPFNGVIAFLEHCARQEVKTAIVSHKTPQVVLDGRPVNLREPALAWLKVNGFFSNLALSPGDVFFEPTRAGKIERIRLLGCTHFIDDLAEVFAHETFPPDTQKLLFAPRGAGEPASPGTRAFRSWHELDRHFFHDN